MVDTQHQRIFEQISSLVKSCEDGEDVEKLQETLDFLVNHTIRHFTDEEALQLEYGYPGYKRHKAMHDEFKAVVDGLVKRFKEGGSSAELSSDVNKTVIRWFVNHIRNEDKRISSHVRAVTMLLRGEMHA